MSSIVRPWNVLTHQVAVITLVMSSIAGTATAAEQWNTYRDPQGSFTCQYPATWHVRQDAPGVVVLAGDAAGLEGEVMIRAFGEDLNFSDAAPGEDRSTWPKMGLDQFMRLMAANNAAFRNSRKTLLNGYNAYEITADQDGGLTFVVMIENKHGAVFQLGFNRRAKADLTDAERQLLASFRFTE